MKMNKDRDVMTDSTLESMKESLKAQKFRYTVPTEALKVQSTASISVLISLSLLITLVMIGLNISLENHASDTNAAGIITSFLAGMFGYATLEFLRRGFQKI
jgi:hypothetical protein